MMKAIIHSLMIIGMLHVFAACGSKANKQSASVNNALQVEGHKVVAQPFDNELVTTASLMPNEQVELKAPIAGQVLRIYFKEGETVQKGAGIIRIDDRHWKAEMVGVRAALDAAEKEFSRKKKLLAIEGASQEELDNSLSKVETLKSQLQQLKINIDLANISAPFAGQLGMRNFSNGAFLKQGDPITTLTEMRMLKVDFAVAQAHSESLTIGKQVSVLVGGDTLKATIYAVNPLIHTQSRTINVRALLAQPANKTIMPGTFAEVLITTNFIKDALLIPTEAVVPSINDQTVYVYRNGRANKKVIKMGNRTADKVHVIEGIAKGDTLITTGLLQIKEGMDIKIQSIN